MSNLAADMSAATLPTATVLGVVLEPGERVLWFSRQSVIREVVVLLVLGFLTVGFVVGAAFFVWAIVAARQKVANVLTTRRVMQIRGKKATQARYADIYEVTRVIQRSRYSTTVIPGGKMTDPQFWGTAKEVKVLARPDLRLTFERFGLNLMMFMPTLCKCWTVPGHAEACPTVPFES
jgi:hypothetical protein